MSRRGHPAGDLREPADMLAHQEERRGHVGGREGLEHWLRGAGVRAVVEGEVGHSLPGGSPAHCAPEEGAVGLVGAVGPGAERGTGDRQEQGHGESNIVTGWGYRQNSKLIVKVGMGGRMNRGLEISRLTPRSSSNSIRGTT